MADDIVIRFTGDPKDLQRALKQIQSALGEAEKQTTSLGQKMQAAGKKMSSAGDNLTRKVSLPLVALGGVALKTSMDFDDAMSKIVGLVGLSADEVDGMRESVLDLAGETAKAPQELAEALFAVTSAGLRGEEAMTALELSAKASTAGLGETKDISLTLAAAMTAYASEGLSAAEATDILVATVREGNLEASDLAGSLGKILPVAQSAGVGLDEVGASIAIMTRSGLSAGDATTALRAAILSMNAPTVEASAALEDAGLSAEELRTTLAEDGVIAALEMVETAAGGDESAFRKLLGSTEALTGSQILLAADSETVASTFDGVADSTGALDKAFEAAQTDGFKMRQALAEAQVALIELGETLAPVASAIAGGVSSAAQAFASLPEPMQTGVVALGGLAAAVGPVMSGLGRMTTGMGKLLDVSPKVWSQLKAGGPILLGVGAAFVGAKLLADQFSNSVKLTVEELSRLKTAELISEFDQLGDMAGNFGGEAEAAAAQLDGFRNVAEQNIGVATRLRDALAAEGRDVSALDAVLQEVAESSVQAGEDQDAAADAVNRFAGATGNAKPPTDAFTESLTWEEQQAKDLKAAIDAVKEATDSLIGVHLSAEQAALRVTGQFATLSETLKENGSTLDINTEKGRANREQLVSTTEAALAHVDALVAEGASADEANFYLAAHVENLKETMRQAGLSESEIDGYIQTLGLTPDNIATIVELRGVTEAEEALANLTRIRSVQIRAQVTGSRTAGLQLRHSGGPVTRGTPYLVGRPRHEELFVPDQSGQIISGTETDRILGRTGGSPMSMGQANVTIDVGGITVVSQSQDPAAVAREVRRELLRVGQRNGTVGLS